MARRPGVGSIPATVGNLINGYKRLCALEGTRPHSNADFVAALGELAATGDMVILRGAALWPDSLQGCA